MIVPAHNVLAAIGRILLALIFVLSGFQKIGGFDATAAMMAGAGLPMVKLLLVLTIAVEVIGGLAVMFGWKTRWAALALAAYTVPVTLVFHNPWTAAAPEVQMQTIHLLKNVSMIGGLLVLAAFGPGRLSLDARSARVV
jgi:putative oxidoreductase